MSATASIDDISATVTATPKTMKWNMGDGTAPITCAGPGRPWAEDTDPPCSHAYTTAGTYTVTVEVTWHATWTSNTGETGREADIVLSTSMPIWVRSAQAVTD